MTNITNFIAVEKSSNGQTKVYETTSKEIIDYVVGCGRYFIGTTTPLQLIKEFGFSSFSELDQDELDEYSTEVSLAEKYGENTKLYYNYSDNESADYSPIPHDLLTVCMDRIAESSQFCIYIDEDTLDYNIDCGPAEHVDEITEIAKGLSWI